MGDVILTTGERVYEVCLAVVRALGTPEDLAAVVAGALRDANVSGHDSHGIVRLPEYVEAVRRDSVRPAARAEVVHRRGATACVSARRGWGQPAARLAAEAAASIAAELGVGAVSLQDSPHVGRLWDYVEAIAAHGQIAMALTNSWADVAPFGGRDRMLGTDPIAFGIPMGAGEPPLIVDFATSVVAVGKVRVAADAGRRVARRTIIDSEGRLSDDPADYYAGGALLPAQGHKGYGLAVAIEAIGGALSGMAPAMLSTYADGNGMFVQALEVSAFTGTERFLDDVRDMAHALRAARPAPSAEEVLVPGDPERRTAEQRRRDGIPIAARTWAAITQVAEELGVAGVESPQARAGRGRSVDKDPLL